VNPGSQGKFNSSELPQAAVIKKGVRNNNKEHACTVQLAGACSLELNEINSKDTLGGMFIK